jgi:hypothetical protein
MMFMSGPLISLDANGQNSVFCSLYRLCFNYRQSILLTNLRRCCVKPLNQDKARRRIFYRRAALACTVDFFDFDIEDSDAPCPPELRLYLSILGSLQHHGQSPHGKATHMNDAHG